MKVELTSEAEKKRAKKWEFLITTSIVEATRTARDMGWKDKKVQVRAENRGPQVRFYVEPYEEGCGCRGILKYEDYFI